MATVGMDFRRKTWVAVSLVVAMCLLVAGEVQSQEDWDYSHAKTEPMSFSANGDFSLASDSSTGASFRGADSDPEYVYDATKSDRAVEGLEATNSFASEDFSLAADGTTGASFTTKSSDPDYVYDATKSEGGLEGNFQAVDSFPAPDSYATDSYATGDLGNVKSGSSTSPGDGFDMVETVDDRYSTSGATDSGASLATQSGGCSTGNPVDDCWRCDPNWASHRQNLANCAIGFGRNAIGGKNGKIYVVTSPRDDNPANPSPGTLRYAVTRAEPLWITFAYSMTIRLKNELIMTSFKTIDGRGVNVQIAGGAGLTIQYVSHIIVHGISIHDIQATGPARIMSSTTHVGDRGRADGDAISVYTSNNLWFDHCYLARAADGLIDVIRGSTDVTISNNYFTQHDKVMLLGAHANDLEDRNMQVTVAYNTFGPGLIQRLPRVRLGSVHVVNNDYRAGWGIYAIGGSEDPTILSEGNIFNPGGGPKQVTKRINDGGSSYGGPLKWNWKSVGDSFMSGAYFTGSGAQTSAQAYAKATSCAARPASMVTSMTSKAGPLSCSTNSRC